MEMFDGIEEGREKVEGEDVVERLDGVRRLIWGKLQWAHWRPWLPACVAAWHVPASGSGPRMSAPWRGAREGSVSLRQRVMPPTVPTLACVPLPRLDNGGPSLAGG